MLNLEELKAKAASLPLEPGVYVMRDSENNVIYVGKAKKLRNRVSQYFQDTSAHTPKTKLMVSKVDHFDVFIASSEFEALVLECSQIKRYMPKYNILLKDDKGYPYLRLDMRRPYPEITMVSKISDDGAGYYGPYGSRGVTQSILETIRLTLKLPACHKKFPRDLNKDRPCLNYHMSQCEGWCQNICTQAEYVQRMEQARQLLLGNYKQVSNAVRQQMMNAAEELNFELAASLRDRLKAVEALSQKQIVVAGNDTEMDVIGFAQTDAKACFAILHFSDGNLVDKEYEVFGIPDDAEAAVSSLMKQYYLSRGLAPKTVLLPFEVEDRALFSDLLQQQQGRKTYFKVPQRGENIRFVELACKNAFEEAQRITTKEEHRSAALSLLGKMLGLPVPNRMESFDISNISGTDIVASMVVFQDGKPHKSDYKRFKIEDMQQQDDYACMRQVLTRRFTHYINGDEGFDVLPDLLLIDGGVAHAEVAEKALSVLGLSIPIFGMVKDNRHRTRALVTASGQEIRIDNQQAVFSLIGNIQEETHRFAITYHRQLRSKRLRHSQLDNIPGIGPKRKQDLLKSFSSVSAIAAATLSELEQFLPRNAAYAVYEHFHKEG